MIYDLVKQCRKCKLKKNITEFYLYELKKKKPVCKKCRNLECVIYYEKNKEKLMGKNSKWQRENVEKMREYNRICYLKHKKERALYMENNRDRYRNWVNNHYKSNINHKLRILISGRMREKLKKDKSDNTINLLGCSIKYFKNYIKSLFQEGMIWDNYGLKKWHLDHIIPCSKFELKNSEEQEVCFHYTNYQPLWAKDNLIKNNKFKEI